MFPLIVVSGLGVIPMISIALLIYLIKFIVNYIRKQKDNNTGQTQQGNYPQNYTPPPSTSGQQQQTYSPPPQSPQSNYQHPYTTPEPSTQSHRNTPIPTQYDMYTGDTTKPKRNAGVIIGLVVGILAVLGGAGVFAINYIKDRGDSGLTSGSFTLAYENPTQGEYFIVLDTWDTIRVSPFTASTNLAYTYKRNQTEFHWQILDANYKQIADTTITESEIETFFLASDIEEWDYTKRIILVNPAKVNFLFWNVWFGEGAGINDTVELELGDSTYLADVTITNAPFIFDHRNATFKTKTEEASRFSELDQNQFLISETDFPAMYERIFPGEDYLSRFNDYRNLLIDLYNTSRDALAVQDNPPADEVDKVNGLESLIPSSVNEQTQARDFVAVIDYVRNEQDYFLLADKDDCEKILDSADVILKESYVTTSRAQAFPPLHYIEYWVERNGLFDDQPKRIISIDWDRSDDGKREY